MDSGSRVPPPEAPASHLREEVLRGVKDMESSSLLNSCKFPAEHEARKRM